MKSKSLTVFILLIFISTFNSKAQNNFNIKVGIANPMADFGSQDLNNDNAAGASTGLNIGLKYTYPLSENGLGLFAALDFNYNGLSRDIKDEIVNTFESIGLLGAEYKYYKYLNIPLSAGLNYTYQANEKVGLFGNGGITINMLKLTDFVVEGSGVKITSEYNMASSIGFRIGGGVTLNKQLSLAIDYYGLGNHNVNGRARSDGVPSEDIDFDMSVNLLTISVGYNF